MDWLGELGGIGGLTASGLLLVLIFLIVRGYTLGKIIPDTMHDRIVAAKDAQIENQQKIIDQVTSQVSLAVEYGETTVKLLQVLAPDEKSSP